MRNFIILIATLFCCSFARAQATPDARPNIVLILADDLGYGDLGCFGCKDIPTPNIDSLARDGTRFTQAYCYNVCSPTRAALLTGRYAERSGIRTVLMGGSVKAFGDATLLPKLLRDNGYVTGLVGKWHLGYDGNVVPTQMGFDEFFGFHGGKSDYFKHTDSTQKNGTPEGKHDLYEGDTEVTREGYLTNLFSDRATKFIRDHKDKPFYLQIAYNAPHYATTPGTYQAPPEYLKKFGVTGDPTKTRGGYAAMVNCMDDGVGLVLAELKKQKLEANTLVIFLSDNGGEDVASNGLYSGGKHNNREGGIRVPWIARWPGHITAGASRDDVLHVTDLMPTLLAITHTTPPKDLAFDGTDARSVFFNEANAITQRTLFFPPRTLRQGQWKLLNNQLFDLVADPGEKENVAKDHPEIAESMAKKLAVMRKDLGLKEKDE